MAETIRFSQLSRQDIRFGRAQFEVTLASGQTVLLDEVDLGFILANLTGLKTYATVALLPAVDATNPGRLARVSADSKFYFDTGTAWIAIGFPTATTGSIFFQTATGIAQDNSNLFWDDTNNRLGVGVNASFTERINIPNNSYLGGRNAAASAYRKLIGINASDVIIIGESGTNLHSNSPFTHNQNVTVATGKTLTLTDATENGLLYAPSTKIVTSTAAMTNGQLVIGSTGNAPSLGTLTGTGNISITNGPGIISIGSTGGRIYNRSTALIQVVNTVAETTIYSFTLSGGDFDIDRVLTVFVGGSYDNSSGATKTLQLKIKIGGVTYFDDTTAAIASSANERAFGLQFSLTSRTVASNADINGTFYLSAAIVAAVGIGGISADSTIKANFRATQTGPVFTQDKLVDITATHSAAAATVDISKLEAFAVLF